MKFFGKPWNAPVCETIERADTPVGQPCSWCEELITPDDRGLLIPVWPGPTELPIHMECQLRSIVGSIAHQERRCGCFVRGSTEGDPPGLTKRQAALAASAAFPLKEPEEA